MAKKAATATTAKEKKVKAVKTTKKAGRKSRLEVHKDAAKVLKKEVNQALKKYLATAA